MWFTSRSAGNSLGILFLRMLHRRCTSQVFSLGLHKWRLGKKENAGLQFSLNIMLAICLQIFELFHIVKKSQATLFFYPVQQLGSDIPMNLYILSLTFKFKILWDSSLGSCIHTLSKYPIISFLLPALFFMTYSALYLFKCFEYIISSYSFFGLMFFPTSQSLA